MEVTHDCQQCGGAFTPAQLRQSTAGLLLCKGCCPGLFRFSACTNCGWVGEVFAKYSNGASLCVACDADWKLKYAQRVAAERAEKKRVAEVLKKIETDYHQAVDVERKAERMAVAKMAGENPAELVERGRAAGGCEVCGRFPILEVHLQQCVGMVLRVGVRDYKARLCKCCGTDLFSDVMKRHAFTTLWSPTALLLGSWTAGAGNLLERARLARLAEPEWRLPETTKA